MKKVEQRRSKIKIVIVDDHELVREGLGLWLEGIQGAEQVGQAAGMREALQLVRATTPDVVLMDVVLADGNGMEATERICKDFPKTRVIILSAHCDEDYVQRSLRAGAAGYVIKDLKLAELETAIRTVHAGEYYLSPAASQVLARMHAKSIHLVHVEPLTKRQLQILKLLAEGLTVKVIGHQLDLSPKTVDMHKARLMRRLNMTNLPSLVRYALQQKLIEP